MGTVTQLGGNQAAVRDAADQAREAGLPTPWLLFQHRDWGDGIAVGHWSASRGFKPVMWPYSALVCGLSSTLEASTVARLRELVWRQEVLARVWVISSTLLTYSPAARHPVPGAG